MIIRPTILAITLLSLSLTECQVKDQSAPNIILIIADDMAWNDCGAYGNPFVRTPNIDRLAVEGLRFNNAFLTCSSCSPSRSSIITGKYPHNTGAEQLHWPLPADQKTFTELMRDAGYWTAAAGKWHLGEEVRDRFDRVVEAGTEGFILPSAAKETNPNMVSENKSGCEDWVPTLNQRPENTPFFLWLAAFDPHRAYEDSIVPDPHDPGNVRVPPYLPDVPGVRKDLAMYYDEISRLDSYVGQVIKELEVNGIDSNTLVVFISDNGRPFPRDKTTLYDGGIKTPLIVRWPARIEGGQICESLISSVDLAPTFLELAGINIPEEMEGHSFRTMLKDTGTIIREFIYAEDHWHDYEDLTRAVRSIRYKFIQNDYPDLPATPPADVGRSISFGAMKTLQASDLLDTAQLSCFISPRPQFEFYDLYLDPDELNNLAQDPGYAGIIEKHREALEKWTLETGFQFPRNRTPDEFDRITGMPNSFRKRPRPDKKWFFEKFEIY